MRINTNMQSIAAQRHVGNLTRKIDDLTPKMSAGERIVKAADDAAGLAISEKMKAKSGSLFQAERNANDGISLIQTAEGGLNEIGTMLIRLRELSVQSANDTSGDEDRKFTELEVKALQEEINRITQVTEFNNYKLLNGTGSNYSVQVGTTQHDQLDVQVGVEEEEFANTIQYDSKLINSSTENLEIDDVSVLTKENSQNSLDILDKAIDKISGFRAELGAKQNRLRSSLNTIRVSNENVLSAKSRIRDLDYADATSENTKNTILREASTSVLSQANMSSRSVLKLIG
jgi:flagellin